MDLSNQIVIHRVFGEGKIVHQKNGQITVIFSQGEKKYKYPFAFKQSLKLKDSALSESIQTDLLIEEDREAKIAEQKRQSILREAQLNAPVSQNKIKPKGKPKNIQRANIAFKCNYCDGGKSDAQIGFNGVCSDPVIHNNINIEKRTWCSVDYCACYKYLQGEITRKELDHECLDGGFVCYESQMLRDWKALAGIVQSGERKGEPMKLHMVQRNSLCVLTTRDPDSVETNRYIFALFLVDETYEGDSHDEGYVTTSSPYKIKLSPAEAHKMLFWNYHANNNQPHKALWSSGLHRYFDDCEAVQILQDVSKLKVNTVDEKLAADFLTHFIRINKIDEDAVLEKNGANMVNQ